MAWTTLDPLTLNKTGGSTPIPLDGQGGQIAIRLPAFAAQFGRYEVGIYTNGTFGPEYVDSVERPLSPFRRYLMFDVPGDLPQAYLSMRMVQHDDLDNVSIEVSPEFQPPQAPAGIPGEGVIGVNLTVDAIAADISRRVQAGSVSAQDMQQLQEHVDALSQAIESGNTISMSEEDGSAEPQSDNPQASDPDAQAFVIAAGISNADTIAALDTLVQTLKQAALWSKLLAIHPFVGGTAEAHSLNLKDPRDANDAYRISWIGSVTHDASGVTGAGGYGKTHIAADEIPSGFASVGVYQSSEAVSPSGVVAGATATRARLYLNFDGRDYSALFRSQFPRDAVPPIRGWFMLSRQSESSFQYYRGTDLTNVGGTFVAPNSAHSWHVLAQDPLSSSSGDPEPSLASLGWHHYGEGLSSGDAGTLRTIVEQFQVNLNRAA